MIFPVEGANLINPSTTESCLNLRFRQFSVTEKKFTEIAMLESSSKDLRYNQTLKVWKACSKTVIIYLGSADLFYAKMLTTKSDFTTM